MENAHARSVDEVCSLLEVKKEVGLNLSDVIARQKKYGPNGK